MFCSPSSSCCGAPGLSALFSQLKKSSGPTPLPLQTLPAVGNSQSSSWTTLKAWIVFLSLWDFIAFITLLLVFSVLKTVASRISSGVIVTVVVVSGGRVNLVPATPTWLEVGVSMSTSLRALWVTPGCSQMRAASQTFFLYMKCFSKLNTIFDHSLLSGFSGTSVRWMLNGMILHLLTFLPYFPLLCHFALHPERCLKILSSHTFFLLIF